MHAGLSDVSNMQVSLCAVAVKRKSHLSSSGSQNERPRVRIRLNSDAIDGIQPVARDDQAAAGGSAAGRGRRAAG